MNLRDGNIFEAMRLVLPEHRGMMAHRNQERRARKSPTLSQDETDQMRYMLSEALENGSPVRLTLFGVYDDDVLEGIPIYDGRLRIKTAKGIVEVDRRRLIDMEYLG